MAVERGWVGSPGTKCPSCGRSACSELREPTLVQYACECCGRRWVSWDLFGSVPDLPPDSGWDPPTQRP